MFAPLPPLPRASLAVLLAAGCAAPPPVPKDSGPQPQLEGRIDVLEVVGAGPSVRVALGPVPMKPMSYEERGGVREGCKAVLYEPSDLALPAAVDEGAVTVDGLGTPVRCAWADGYRCGTPGPIAGAEAVSATISPAPVGRFRFGTVPAVSAPSPFTLDTASAALLAHLPLEDQPITLSCTGAGGACADADNPEVISWIRFVSTDADLSAAGPTELPAPRHLQAVVECVTPGSATVTVPARAMAYLMNAAPTRVHATYARVHSSVTANPDGLAPVTLRVGQAVQGYTTP